MKQIPLTRGCFAMVDDEDYDRITAYGKWLVIPNGIKIIRYYACRYVGPRGHSKRLAMHRVIMNAPDGMEVDHIDGNALNNQKANLRVVSRRENSRNLHILKYNTLPGAHWHKITKKWQVQIKIHGSNRTFGYFNTEQEASEKYSDVCKLIDLSKTMYIKGCCNDM